MDGWVTFWKVVLYAGIGLFACLSAWVIVAGFGDIRKMFAALREERED
ncbi:MAG: hypothetical protein ABFS86_16340 [Planctomycetota bacterium]